MRCHATSLWFGKSPPSATALDKGCGDRRGLTGQLSLGAGAAATLIFHG